MKSINIFFYLFLSITVINVPTETLKEKLTESKRYQPEAIEAANKILKQREQKNDD